MLRGPPIMEHPSEALILGRSYSEAKWLSLVLCVLVILILGAIFIISKVVPGFGSTVCQQSMLRLYITSVIDSPRSVLHCRQTSLAMLCLAAAMLGETEKWEILIAGSNAWYEL